MLRALDCAPWTVCGVARLDDMHIYPSLPSLHAPRKPHESKLCGCKERITLIVGSCSIARMMQAQARRW
jgi:hypothetical protein